MVRLIDSKKPEPPTIKLPLGSAHEPTAEDEALDKVVLAAIATLEKTGPRRCARWDDAINLVRKDSPTTTAEQVEESFNRLMDKGLVYEPTLGMLQVT